MKKTLILNEKVLTISEWLTENQPGEIQTTQTTDIKSDIDTILAKLKDLEDNIEEALHIYEEYSTILNEEELNEDETGKIKDFVFIAPRVRKMQQKANKIRLNKVDLDFAIANAPSDKKKRIQAKAKDLGKDVTELEDSIDDYQKDSGATYSLKVKNMERIKGKLAAIKRKTGLEDDPKKKTDLRRQMQTLADDFKDEAEAAKELQDKEGPSKEEIKRRQQAAQDAQDAQKVTPTTPKDGKPASTTTPEGGKPASTTTPEGGEPKVKGQTEQTPEQKAKNSKEGMIKRYKELLAKTNDEEKKEKYQQKIDDLQAESWEAFLDNKYVAILEAELVEFEKAILS